jgi:hypothetical protein
LPVYYYGVIPHLLGWGAHCAPFSRGEGQDDNEKQGEKSLEIKDGLGKLQGMKV